MLGINELFKYSWFADTAYVNWSDINNTRIVINDVIKAERLAESTSGSIPSGDGLASHVFD